MFNIFNSNVFVEIGEAIGNVGKAVFRKRSPHVDWVDEAFRRRLQQAERVRLPRERRRATPKEDVVEASFVEVRDEQERL